MSSGANVSRFELGPAAFHGLPGKTVHTIDPVTEADPAGLLVNLLTFFGAAVGPGAFTYADGARHSPHLFALVVGRTARSRKSTSGLLSRNIFVRADPYFVKERTFSGFGSGEALVEAVGSVVDGDDETSADHDPRALILESEFSRILRVAERDGSTLSAVLRQAWDGGELSVLTRKRPVRAPDAHIAVAAQITEEELHSRLRGVDLANGLANRFIFVRVERSKRIPDGRGLDDDEVAQLASEWRRMLERARAIPGPIRRSNEASALWHDWYMSLDDDRPGMLGALLARAEAQVLRLSLIYALADGEAAIDTPHLHAALDVWRYAERSVLAIFGDAVGDPVADLILRRLRDRFPEGMTRTEIRDALGRHEREVTIEAALDVLGSRNLARCEREPTGGRPTERWYATFVGDQSDETRPKGSSVASVALVAAKVGSADASVGERWQASTDGAGEDRSQALKPAHATIRTIAQVGSPGVFKAPEEPVDGSPGAPA